MAPISYHLTPFRPRLRGSEMGPSRGRRRRAVWDAESLPLSRAVPLSRKPVHPVGKTDAPPHRAEAIVLGRWHGYCGPCLWGSSGWWIRVWSPREILVVSASSHSPGAPSQATWSPAAPAGCPPPRLLLSQARGRGQLSSRLVLCCGHVTFSPGFISEPQATPFKGSEELIRAVCLSR